MKKLPKETKFLIIGGHMTPALSVVDELIADGYENIIWVGHQFSQTGDKNFSAEYHQVNKLEITFIHLKTGKIWRKWTPNTLDKAIYNLLLIPYGFLQAALILIRERPKVIMGFGGYLSVPIITNWLINKLNSTRIYIHSQTLEPDVSTKITAKFATEIFVSYSRSAKHFGKKATFTGNPLNREFFDHKTKVELFDNNLPILLVLGGNQGANTFNKRLRDGILQKYLKNMNIIHQTGSSSLTNDYEIAKSQLEKLPEKLQPRYKVYNFIQTEELNPMLNTVSLALSRSGANTTQLLMLKGVPTVLMPIPWSARQEQLKNAELAEETGLAHVFEFQDGLKPAELYKVIKSALEQTTHKESFKKSTSWTKAKKQAREMIIEDAAKRIEKKVTGN